MTDQELIQALQMCSKVRCPDCLKEHTVCYRRKWMADASTRLETLLAEKQRGMLMANEQRLIDANKIKYTIQSYGGWGGEPEKIVRDYEIDRMPTIDAEPVVHAYWELYNENSDDYWKKGWRCSHCRGYHFHRCTANA